MAPEEKSISGLIWDRYDDAKKKMATIHEQWVENEKAFHGLVDRANYPYNSTLSAQYVKGTIETMAPQLIGSMMGDSVGGKIFQMDPEEQTDEDQVEINEQVMMKKLRAVRYLYPKVSVWQKNALKFGWSPAMVPYIQKTKKVSRTVRIEEFMLIRIMNTFRRANKPRIDFSKERRKIISYQGFDLVPWSPFNVFLADLTKLDIQDQPYLFMNFLTTLADLKRMEAEGFPLNKSVFDKVKEDGIFTTDDEEERKREIQEDIFGHDETERYTDEEIFPIKVIQYFSKSEDRWVWLSHTKRELMDRKMPYDHGDYPAAVIVNRPEHGNALGESEVRIISDMGDAIDLSINCREDSKALLQHPMFKLDTNANFRLGEFLLSTPGLILRGTDVSGLEQLKTQVDMSGIVDEDRYIRHIQVLTGVMDVLRGANPEGFSDTVGGLNLLANMALNRFRLQVRLNEVMGLRDFLLLGWGLLMQYQTKAEVIRIVGEKGARWVEIPRDNFLIPYDFKMTAGSEEFHRTTERQQMIQLLPLAAQLAGSSFNARYALTRMLRLFNEPNPELWTVDQPRRDPNVENIMLLQGQRVEVLPEDNHLEHLQSHRATAGTPLVQKDVPESAMNFQEHIQQHEFLAQQAAQQPAGRGVVPEGAGSQLLNQSEGNFAAQGTGTRGPQLRPTNGGQGR